MHFKSGENTYADLFTDILCNAPLKEGHISFLRHDCPGEYEEPNSHRSLPTKAREAPMVPDGSTRMSLLDRDWVIPSIGSCTSIGLDYWFYPGYMRARILCFLGLNFPRSWNRTRTKVIFGWPNINTFSIPNCHVPASISFKSQSTFPHPPRSWLRNIRVRSGNSNV